MRTTALRLHGKMDLRLDTFELPALGDDEILAEVVCNSLCMSDFKIAEQGYDHKRVPKGLAKRAVIVGHEFSGVIIQVGEKWKDEFKEGERFCVQPLLNYNKSWDTVGYSFATVGGIATRILIPSCVMEMGCLLRYDGDAFFEASLSEPISCIISALKAQYHVDPETGEHQMGIREGGRTALLGAAGPMGLAALDLLVHGPRKPSLLVVTDIAQVRLERAQRILAPRKARSNGVRLIYVNTKGKDPVKGLLELTGSTGYDDVFVFAPVAELIEQADRILASDGCLNFFAGPTSSDFTARFNFYNVHYARTHVVGTSGSDAQDMRDALEWIGHQIVNPTMMVTHVGGLRAAKKATLGFPDLAGGKKLIYTHIDLPLTAVDAFGDKGNDDPLFRDLAEICDRNNGFWSREAESFLLERAPRLML